MPRGRETSPSSPAAPRSAPGASGSLQPNDDPRQLDVFMDFVNRGRRAQAAVDETLERMQQELEADAARSRRRRRGGHS
jgi:hypothetical protein